MIHNLTRRYTIYLILFTVVMSFLLLNISTIVAQDLAIVSPTASSSVPATQYQFFSLVVDINGGVNPYDVTATGLPNGLIVDIDDDGNGATIVGAASVSGTFNVTINVSDSNPSGAETTSVNFDIVVSPLAANTIEINVPNVFILSDGTVS